MCLSAAEPGLPNPAWTALSGFGGPAQAEFDTYDQVLGECNWNLWTGRNPPDDPGGLASHWNYYQINFVFVTKQNETKTKQVFFMPKKKIEDYQIIQGLKNGLTATQIAENLGVTSAAVRTRARKLKLAVSQNVTLQSAGEVVQADLNLAEDMRQIMEGTRETLALLEAVARGDKDPAEAENLLSGKTSVLEGLHKTRQEARQQVSLMFDILKNISSLREVKQLQEVIMQEVQNADPETARKIVERLSHLGSAHNLMMLGK